VPRFELKKPYEVEKLFFYLVSNMTGLFTFNKLAHLVDLSDKTVRDYISFFEDAFLLYTVDRFDFSVKKLRGPKKIYCVDNGLSASVAFSFSENRGRYLENMVFGTLVRNEQNIFYYKTKTGLEVDFFCPGIGGRGQLLQVCADLQDEKIRKREIRALCMAADELDLEGGTIVTMDEEEEIMEQGKAIKIIPAWKYFSIPGF